MRLKGVVRNARRKDFSSKKRSSMREGERQQGAAIKGRGRTHPRKEGSAPTHTRILLSKKKNRSNEREGKGNGNQKKKKGGLVVRARKRKEEQNVSGKEKSQPAQKRNHPRTPQDQLGKKRERDILVGKGGI